MAFKSVQKKLTDTMTNIYTTPTGSSSIIFSGFICNIDTAEAEVKVDVQLTINSVTTNLLKAVPIPYGGYVVLPKVVVPAGGILKAAATTATFSNKIDMTLSILEQTA